MRATRYRESSYHPAQKQRFGSRPGNVAELAEARSAFGLAVLRGRVRATTLGPAARSARGTEACGDRARGMGCWFLVSEQGVPQLMRSSAVVELSSFGAGE